MEVLPNNVILKYNADTMMYLRKMYNLDKPGQMDEAVDLLDAWVKKQNHFVKKDFPRDYLERVIIQVKGSVERAKTQIDRICTLRNLLPKYFEKCDAINNFSNLSDFLAVTFLPHMTENNMRVMFAKYKPVKITPSLIMNVFAICTLLCEYLKAHDYCNGVIVVADSRDMNVMDYIANLNITNLKEILTIFLKGYSTRVQHFLFISNSKTIEVFVKILKELMSEKLANRVHVVANEEELQKFIPKALLPSDYGGDQETIDVLTDKVFQEFGTKDNVEYFKKMSKATTIESLRISTEHKGEFADLAGTFRTLNVD